MHHPRTSSTYLRTFAGVARAQNAVRPPVRLLLAAAALLGGLPCSGSGCAASHRRDLLEREEEVAALKLELGRRRDLAEQDRKAAERLGESVRGLESEKSRLVSELARRQTESEYHAERASVLEKSLRSQDQRVLDLERRLEETGRVAREILSVHKDIGGSILGSLRATEVPERAEESGIIYFPVAPMALRELHTVLDGIRSRLSRSANLVRRLELESSGTQAGSAAGEDLEFAAAAPLPLLTDRSSVAEPSGAEPKAEGWRLASGGGLAASRAGPAARGFWGEMVRLVRGHVVRLFEPGRRWDTADVGFLGAVLIGAVLVFLVLSTPFRWMLREVREKELALLRRVVGSLDRSPAAAAAPGLPTAGGGLGRRRVARAAEPVATAGTGDPCAEAELPGAPEPEPGELDADLEGPGTPDSNPDSNPDSPPEELAGQPMPDAADLEDLRLTQPLPGRTEVSMPESSGDLDAPPGSPRAPGWSRREASVPDEDLVATQEVVASDLEDLTATQDVVASDLEDLTATQEIAADLVAPPDGAPAGETGGRTDHEATQRIAAPAAPPRAAGRKTQPLREIDAEDLVATQSISDALDGPAAAPAAPPRAAGRKTQPLREIDAEDLVATQSISDALDGPAAAAEPEATQRIPDLEGASSLAPGGEAPSDHPEGSRGPRGSPPAAAAIAARPLPHDSARAVDAAGAPRRERGPAGPGGASDGIVLHETTVIAEPGGTAGSDLRATQVIPDLTLEGAPGRTEAPPGSSEETRKPKDATDRLEPIPPRGSKGGNRSQRTRRTLASDKDLLAEIEELIGRRLDPESR